MNYELNDDEKLYEQQIKKFIDSLLQKKFLFMSKQKIDIPQLRYLDNIYDFTAKDTEYLIPENLQTLTLDIIESCPLQCIYCLPSAPKVERDKTMLTFEKIKELVDDGIKLRARNLVLSGGEPLIHPDIYKIIRYAYDKGFYDVKISTKATTITQEKAFKLRQAGLKDIQVSIDSNNPYMYEKMVGIHGMYSKMMEGLYHLLYYNFRVIVKAVVTKYNIDDIPSLCKEMISKGVNEFKAEIVLPIGRGEEEMLPTIKQLEQVENKLNQIQERYNLNYDILGYKKYGNAAVCSGAINSVAVFSNGDVSFCERIAPLLKYVKFGNVYKDSLMKIWHSNQINKFRKLRNDDSNCKKCEDKQKCLGGCLLNSWIKYRNWRKPDPLCSKISGIKDKPVFIRD